MVANSERGWCRIISGKTFQHYLPKKKSESLIGKHSIRNREAVSRNLIQSEERWMTKLIRNSSFERLKIIKIQFFQCIWNHKSILSRLKMIGHVRTWSLHDNKWIIMQKGRFCLIYVPSPYGPESRPTEPFWARWVRVSRTGRKLEFSIIEDSLDKQKE